MKLKTIILVNGLPRAGKDTVSDFIVNKGYEKLSFATIMKEIIARSFDITLEQLDEYKNYTDKYQIKLGSSPLTNFRKLLQKFGTEGMKPFFGDSVWADLVYKKIINENKEKVIISDFRFLCEYQNPKDYKVITVLVKDKRELPLEGHASDVELYQNNFKFDYIIENTGTLEELEQKVNNFIEKI